MPNNNAPPPPSNPVLIKDAQSYRDALQTQFLADLQKFEKDTGLCIRGIELAGCEVRAVGDPKTKTEVTGVRITVVL